MGFWNNNPRCALCGREMRGNAYNAARTAESVSMEIAWRCEQCDMTPAPTQVPREMLDG
jgi:ribosomal protein L37AE/L43A